jgi:hypothetical protein
VPQLEKPHVGIALEEIFDRITIHGSCPLWKPECREPGPAT